MRRSAIAAAAAPKFVGGGGGGGGTTLDPVTATNMTLSNGNLTTVANANTAGIRSTTPVAGRKVYLELTPNTVTTVNCNFGFATSGFVVGGVLGTCFSTGVSFGAYYSTPDGIYNNTETTGNASDGADIGFAIVPSTLIDIAYDDTAMLFWVRGSDGNWNGSPTANPATGAGGFTVNLHSSTFGDFNGDVRYFYSNIPFDTQGFSVRFASTDWLHAPPEGFIQL